MSAMEAKEVGTLDFMTICVHTLQHSDTHTWNVSLCIIVPFTRTATEETLHLSRVTGKQLLNTTPNP